MKVEEVVDMEVAEEAGDTAIVEDMAVEEDINSDLIRRFKKRMDLGINDLDWGIDKQKGILTTFW